jgi:hypothetical protein
MAPRGAPRRGRGALAAAVAAAAVTSSAAAALPASWGTSPVASLGGAGSPTVATPFFSYYANWQFNTTVATTNANFNVLRARPRAASRAALCALPACETGAW